MEDGQVYRIGGNEPIKVNVRVLSATHRDLEEAVAKGSFRQDLYFRLKVVTITLPPLRDRREDIILLAFNFMKEFSQRYGRNVTSMTADIRRAFTNYDWPGNVRELKGVVESMVALDRDGELGIDDLPDSTPLRQIPQREPEVMGQQSLIGQPLEIVEAFYIQKALELADGNREEAAKMLKIGERTLYRKIKDYHLITKKRSSPV